MKRSHPYRRKAIFWPTIGLMTIMLLVGLFWPIKSDRTGVLLDAKDAGMLKLGGIIYSHRCASCHGSQLEGQSGWREPDLHGRWLAPPHNEQGHTWRHPDNELISMVYGNSSTLTEPHAHGSNLDREEVIAVLSFIKSHWSPEQHAAQEARTTDFQ
jgi:mono/diheme cytochrome c family protein